MYRDKVFGPLVYLLSKARVRPTQITALSILVVLPFPVIARTYPLFAFGLIVAHLLLDAVDGPLARSECRSTSGGALLDIIADHSVFAVVVLGLVYQGLLSGALGIAYVYLYILLIGCTIAQNALQQPVPTFVRTKYGLYAVYGLYALTGLSWFNFAAGVSIVLAVVPLLISVKSLSKHLV